MGTWLFIKLLLGHWAGDYTHLSRPYMLAAKKFGKPLKPIFDHAVVHGVISGLIVGLHYGSFLMGATALAIMTITHFLIDALKGLMNVWFPSLQNQANVFHWWVFGGDQTLHILVLVLLSNLDNFQQL